jgi:hypothetical protein
MNNDARLSRGPQRKVEITVTGEARQFEVGGQSVTFVPLAIKRRSYSKELVTSPGRKMPISNHHLICR